MALFDRFDFTHGQLPPWLAPLVSLTRPLSVSLTGMLIPVGAFCCGMAALFSAEAGLRMAAASSAFLRGIPGELYALVASVFSVYSLSKTAEVIKAPPPAGGTSPEKPQPAVSEEPAQHAPAPTPETIYDPPGTNARLSTPPDDVSGLPENLR